MMSSGQRGRRPFANTAHPLPLKSELIWHWVALKSSTVPEGSMLLSGGNTEKMGSVPLFLGMLTILTITVYVPSTHGEPFLLQENRVLPEREDANHEDTLLTLLLNKKLAWRRPENIDWELAKKFEELEQLEKLKDQLSTEEGSEVAYALESLSASQPRKRACFWKYCI
uniref:Urotensin 2B n=1 Tax=Falco tinnunculus TaxID=100819 RepID=A0A8C4V592_FALTI